MSKNVCCICKKCGEGVWGEFSLRFEKTEEISSSVKGLAASRVYKTERHFKHVPAGHYKAFVCQECLSFIYQEYFQPPSISQSFAIKLLAASLPVLIISIAVWFFGVQPETRDVFPFISAFFDEYTFLVWVVLVTAMVSLGVAAYAGWLLDGHSTRKDSTTKPGFFTDRIVLVDLFDEVQQRHANHPLNQGADGYFGTWKMHDVPHSGWGLKIGYGFPRTDWPSVWWIFEAAGPDKDKDHKKIRVIGDNYFFFQRHRYIWCKSSPSIERSFPQVACTNTLCRSLLRKAE